MTEYCCFKHPGATWFFTLGVNKGLFFPPHRKKSADFKKPTKTRREGLWQRRFWEHLIRDEIDYRQHVDYIYWNPVKHGWVSPVMDWPHSSFHGNVAQGAYPENWGNEIELPNIMGE
jgi:putative transposase